MTPMQLTSFNAPILGPNDPPPPSGIPGIITAIGQAVGAALHPTTGTTLPPGMVAVPVGQAPQQAGMNNIMMFLLLGALLFFLMEK